jgi:cell division septation protein DedD
MEGRAIARHAGFSAYVKIGLVDVQGSIRRVRIPADLFLERVELELSLPAFEFHNEDLVSHSKY